MNRIASFNNSRRDHGMFCVEPRKREPSATSVDEAFLRRIPFKIDVADPTEAQFRQLTQAACESAGIICHDSAVDHLLDKHYRPQGRHLRFCHPRDLIDQVAIYCDFLEQPLELTETALDHAAENYFGMI